MVDLHEYIDSKFEWFKCCFTDIFLNLWWAYMFWKMIHCKLKKIAWFFVVVVVSYTTFLHLFAWGVTLIYIKLFQKNALSSFYLSQMQTIRTSLGMQPDTFICAHQVWACEGQLNTRARSFTILFSDTPLRLNRDSEQQEHRRDLFRYTRNRIMQAMSLNDPLVCK